MITIQLQFYSFALSVYEIDQYQFKKNSEFRRIT